MPLESQRLIVNADDYAMDKGVDDAIIDLAERGTVTAASAMVLSPRWAEAARRLRDAPLDCGLHLDLTSPFASTRFPPLPLPRLILLAYTRRIDPDILKQVIGEQLDLFETAAGKPPDFIDGHQHVHHLPVIRDALMEAVAHRYGAEGLHIYFRICKSGRWRGIKAAIIEATGSRGLERLARSHGHFQNTDFAGVYNFDGEADLASLWRRWLTRMTGRTPLIMCHVASRSATDMADDPIRKARLHEYDWLSSAGFLDLCQQHSVSPAPWPRV